MIQDAVLKHAQQMLELSTAAIGAHTDESKRIPPHEVRFLLNIQRSCFDFLDATERARKAAKK